MNTHRALNFMSTKGNQEASKSGSIKYAKMNGLCHYFCTRHAYTSDWYPKEMLSLSFQSKKNINKIVSVFETIKTKKALISSTQIYLHKGEIFVQDSPQWEQTITCDGLLSDFRYFTFIIHPDDVEVVAESTFWSPRLVEPFSNSFTVHWHITLPQLLAYSNIKNSWNSFQK